MAAQIDCFSNNKIMQLFQIGKVFSSNLKDLKV